MPYGSDLIPIRFYDDPLEAHMARCLLENEGIAAFVHDEHIVGLNRLFSYAVGGVKLKVQGVDRTAALKVLDSTEHLPFLDEEERPIACPKCGSEELSSNVSSPVTPAAMIQWVFAVLFAVYPISLQQRLQCNHCSHLFPRKLDSDQANRPDA